MRLAIAASANNRSRPSHRSAGILGASAAAFNNSKSNRQVALLPITAIVVSSRPLGRSHRSWETRVSRSLCWRSIRTPAIGRPAGQDVFGRRQIGERLIIVLRSATSTRMLAAPPVPVWQQLLIVPPAALWHWPNEQPSIGGAMLCERGAPKSWPNSYALLRGDLACFEVMSGTTWGRDGLAYRYRCSSVGAKTAVLRRERRRKPLHRHMDFGIIGHGAPGATPMPR